MKNIIKESVILLIVSMMGIGLGASTIEASPRIQQLDDQDQARDGAEINENERHEHAMERRPNESEQGFDERQRNENERHERRLWIIAHAVVI